MTAFNFAEKMIDEFGEKIESFNIADLIEKMAKISGLELLDISSAWSTGSSYYNIGIKREDKDGDKEEIVLLKIRVSDHPKRIVDGIDILRESLIDMDIDTLELIAARLFSSRDKWLLKNID